jgi:hypothetical protein
MMMTAYWGDEAFFGNKEYEIVRIRRESSPIFLSEQCESILSPHIINHLVFIVHHLVYLPDINTFIKMSLGSVTHSALDGLTTTVSLTSMNRTQALLLISIDYFLNNNMCARPLFLFTGFIRHGC